jgi:uncharacterized protein YqeY
MLLKENLSKESILALKNKQPIRKGAIVQVLSEIKNLEKAKKIENASDIQVLQLIEKAIKQRKESIKMFTDGGRIDLAEKEEKEMNVLKEFLPKQLSEKEVTIIIENTITETGASTMKQMGLVIGKIRPFLQGKADMGLVSSLVKAKLS